MKIGKLITLISCVIVMLITSSLAAAGEEKVGNLVFETLRKFDASQKKFTGEVQQIRSERGAAVKEKEEAKNRFLKSKDGSLLQNEAHAQFTLAWARILHSSVTEVQMVEGLAADHMIALNRLKDGLKNGSNRVDTKTMNQIVEYGRKFITNSSAAFTSLASIKDSISDPKTQQALSNAASTALMMQTYFDRLQQLQGSNATQKKILMEQVDSMMAALETLYVQSGIVLDLFKDQAVMLKVSNELAITDLMLRGLTNNQLKVSSIQDEVLEPLKGVLEDMDGDSELLLRGSGNKTFTGSDNGKPWYEKAKELKGGLK